MNISRGTAMLIFYQKKKKYFSTLKMDGFHATAVFVDCVPLQMHVVYSLSRLPFIQILDEMNLVGPMR